MQACSLAQYICSSKLLPLILSVSLFQFKPSCQWEGSAPLRTITVRDALSDLPSIPNGHSKEEIPYDGDSVSNFQRKVIQVLCSQYLLLFVVKSILGLTQFLWGSFCR